VENGWRDERVWCVRTRTKNIITRRNGKIIVMGNCEGWDQPSVKCAVLARPTQSLGLFLQQAGRILRPYQDQGAVILDHAGCALRHGLPQDDREFTLDGRKRKEKEDGSTVRRCPECEAIVRRETEICPYCSHRFTSDKELPHVEGELEQIKLPSVKVRKAFYRERLEDAAVRGYKLGWARHRYHAQYAKWPSFSQLEREYLRVTEPPPPPAERGPQLPPLPPLPPLPAVSEEPDSNTETWTL
jgi:hypothetical protein